MDLLELAEEFKKLSNNDLNVSMVLAFMCEEIAKLKKRDHDLKDAFSQLKSYYKKSVLVSHSSPDQYQFRQNQLTQVLCEFIMAEYSYLDDGKLTID